MMEVKIVCILKEVMREKNVTVTQLAVMTGIPASRIARYMAPVLKTYPKIDDAAKIATALEVSIDYIWRIEGI